MRVTGRKNHTDKSKGRKVPQGRVPVAREMEGGALEGTLRENKKLQNGRRVAVKAKGSVRQRVRQDGTPPNGSEKDPRSQGGKGSQG